MVNPFTASTVMQGFTKKYRFQTRSYEPDGVGGFVSGWQDGPEFEAVERHDTTVEAQVAEQADTASTYTLLVNTGVPLAFPDYIKRVSDGQTFQITRAKPRRNPAWGCEPSSAKRRCCRNGTV